MLEKIHSRFEAWLILIAAKILLGRNFARSAVTSRADNNTMWYMGEKLQAIAARIKADYPGFEAVEHVNALDGVPPQEPGDLTPADVHAKMWRLRQSRRQ